MKVGRFWNFKCYGTIKKLFIIITEFTVIIIYEKLKDLFGNNKRFYGRRF